MKITKCVFDSNVREKYRSVKVYEYGKLFSIVNLALSPQTSSGVILQTEQCKYTSYSAILSVITKTTSALGLRIHAVW